MTDIGAGEQPATLFDAMTSRHPSLRIDLVSKPALQILSHLIEDLVSGAGGATLFTGFQQRRFWEVERGRYDRLSQNARIVAIYADDGDTSAQPATAIPVSPDHPLAEDWYLVCIGPHTSVLLCARDLHHHTTPDEERLFRVAVTTEPAVVREALGLLTPALAGRAAALDQLPPGNAKEQPAQPDAARVAQQNNDLIGGLLAEIDALRRRERRAHSTAERLHEENLSTADDERRRLAESLHDQSLQYLLAAHQDLEEHAEIIGTSSPHLIRAQDHLSHGLRHLRRVLSDGLTSRPSSVDLSARLTTMAQQIGEHGGFHTTVTADRTPLTPPQEDTIASIVRELLINTAKHAHAHEAQLSLRHIDDHITLTYHDDGVGFAPADAAAARESGHIGLAIIGDRARTLSATLTVKSAPGSGATFELQIPLG